METVYVNLLVALVGVIFAVVLYFSVSASNKRKAKKKRQNERLDEYESVFLYAGVSKQHARKLAEIQLNVGEVEKMEGGQRMIPVHMAGMIRAFDKAFRELDKHPDNAACLNLQSIAMGYLVRKGLTKEDYRKRKSYWSEVAQILAQNDWDPHPLFDQIFFRVVLEEMMQTASDVQAIEVGMSGVVINFNSHIEERWWKWLYEYVPFRDLLEKELQCFRTPGTISLPFREYYNRWHSPYVRMRLDDLCNDLISWEMREKYFPHGDTHIGNETYNRFAEAYREYRKSFFDRNIQYVNNPSIRN